MSNDSFISKIKQVSASNKVDCYLRSTGNTSSFLPLSIKQQKDIIKTAMDIITSPITFSNITTEIINSNLLTKTPISIIDKPLILLALRANSLGVDAFTNVNDDRVKINFSENLKFNLPADLNSLDKVVKYDKIEVTLKVPTLDEDYRVNVECKRALDNKKIKEEEKLKDLVGELYIYEVSKFIDTVKILVNDKIEEVKFCNLSTQQSVETLEALPMALTNKLIDSISKIREIETQPLKITVNGVDAAIVLDAAFFARE